MKAMFRIVALLLATQLMLSCSFYPPVKADDPQSIINGVRIGEEVVIVSHRGKISQFAVTRITNKALYGEGYRVGFDEIKSIEVEGHPSVLSELFKSKSEPKAETKRASKAELPAETLPEVVPPPPAAPVAAPETKSEAPPEAKAEARP